MKRWCWIFLFLAAIIHAQELTFFTSLEQAQQEAQREKKPLLIMFTQERCSACEYMKERVFEDEMLSSYMHTQFVLLELDINKQNIPMGLKVYGTPTFYVLNQNGQKVGRQFVGGAQAPAFLNVLKQYKAQL
ncbi:thioredoxin family protein [Candidatus Marinarcus aquaticus]|uniref:Thioredoxin n=1 Tax=Candidatus Marinarcus aquaticus TaxID=2044504 RepID=A0A4Q0XNE7_9BACT|nr:thioredoxin family protein [Candidatus Marinarcus aquaticus]RXJ53777.1 thioredoxin [Candidatus Marinarcus aquaticus]